MSNLERLNLINIPKELNLILTIMREDDPKEVFFDDDVDWEKFLELSLHHRLFPVLYTKVMKQTGIPESVQKTFEYYYKTNTLQMLNLVREMVCVHQLFEKNQIRVLFLKGPVLASELYEDVSKRTSCDLDCLIPLESLEMVDELLVENGYVKDDYIKSILGDWKWRHHHVTYTHPSTKVKVEIHWRLNPGPSIEPSFEELWSRRNEKTYFQKTLFHLGREDLFIFLVSHGARHGWSRLRWLLDVHQLLKLDINFPLLKKLLSKYGTFYLAGHVLLLTNNLFNTPIDPIIRKFSLSNKSQRLAQQTIYYLENMINLHTQPIPKHIQSYHARHLFNLMSYKQRALYIASLAFPFPEDAETFPLPRLLHIFYFPLRPFLILIRRVKKKGNKLVAGGTQNI